MSRGRRPDFLPLFRLLLCLAAGVIVFSRRCVAENHSQFRQRSVVVDVDGVEVIEEDSAGQQKNYGICSYVTVSLEGELDDAVGNLTALVPEDCFLYGKHEKIGYYRVNLGRKDLSLTVPATGEESVIPWHGLIPLSDPFVATKYTYVLNREYRTVFDGKHFQSMFQIYYRNKQPFFTSGLAIRASGYTGTSSRNTIGLYEDWFRARYNHNYEIRYDYGFVEAEKRGYAAEQGILHENLCYFALPKQLTDPGDDARYCFLGWRLSGSGTEYTPWQGSEKASFKYGQPAESSEAALMTAAAPMTASAPLSLPKLAVAAPAAAVEPAAEAAAEISAVQSAEAQSNTLSSGGMRSTASDLPHDSG